MRHDLIARWTLIAGLALTLFISGCVDLAAALPPTPSPFPTLPRLPTVTPVTPEPIRSPVTIILGPSATATPSPEQWTGRALFDANVRTGPGTSFPVVTVVPAGTEVTLEGQRANWYVVRLPDGQSGWMAAAVLDVDPVIATRIPVVAP